MSNQIALYMGRADGSLQKRYRITSLLTFCVAAALPLIRLLSYYLPIKNDALGDTVFTLLVQVCMLGVMPTLFYVFALKMKPKQIMEFSNMRKTKWYNLLLAVPIGLCAHVVTIFVSSRWQSFISILGYTHTSTPLPEVFSPGLFVLELVLGALMPAFFEEYFNRGGLLTTVRGSSPFIAAIVIMGIEFGLFHQYVTQVYYTMLFGALMAFITLKSKSVFPAMIIHFVNNATATVNEYCDTYGFFNGGFYGIIYEMQDRNPMLLTVLYVVFLALLAGLVVLLVRLNSNKTLAKKKQVIMDSGFDQTHGRVVLLGEEDRDKVRELGLDKEVYGEKLKEELYKPQAGDNAFFIGAIVITVLTTVFSFVFGCVI